MHRIGVMDAGRTTHAFKGAFTVDERRLVVGLVQRQRAELPIQYIVHLPHVLAGRCSETYVGPSVIQLERVLETHRS